MERKFGSLDGMIKSISEDWGIKEKARAAYIMLGSNSFYNTRYNHLFGYPQLEIFEESDSFKVPNIRSV